MIVKRKLFSNDKKKEGSKNTPVADGLIIGSGLGVALHKTPKSKNLIDRATGNINGRLNNLMNKTSDRAVKTKDNKDILDRLKKTAKDRGIRVAAVPGEDGGTYIKPVPEVLIEGYEEIKKKDPEKAKKLVESFKKKRGYDPTKGTIILGENSSAATLAHELGHSDYLEKKSKTTSKSIIGRTAHKIVDNPTYNKVLNGKLLKSSSAAHGFMVGVNSERKKQRGEKRNLYDKIGSVALPAAIVAPVLISEGKASLRGLKLMKNMGASKELLKQSKKELGSAWGTYASGHLSPVLHGAAGDVAGRGYAKLTKKKDKDE